MHTTHTRCQACHQTFHVDDLSECVSCGAHFCCDCDPNCPCCTEDCEADGSETSAVTLGSVSIPSSVTFSWSFAWSL